MKVMVFFVFLFLLAFNHFLSSSFLYLNKKKAENFTFASNSGWLPAEAAGSCTWKAYIAYKYIMEDTFETPPLKQYICTKVFSQYPQRVLKYQSWIIPLKFCVLGAEYTTLLMMGNTGWNNLGEGVVLVLFVGFFKPAVMITGFQNY